MNEEEKVGLGSFIGANSGRYVLPYVLYNPKTDELTWGIEYVSSDATPNSSNQLEKSDARMTEKAAADERVHNLFNQNSWMNFFGTQALGAAAAGLGAVAAPYVGALMTPSTYLDVMGAPAWLGTAANLGTSGYFLYNNGKEFVKDPSLYNGVMTALSAIPMTRSSSEYTNWLAKALRGVSGGKYTGYGYMGNVLHNTPLTGEYVANGFTPTTLFTKGQTNPYFTPENTLYSWNKLLTAANNREFINAYNKWNKFGYPEIPKNLEYDTEALEAFVKGLLNRHNTFSRGVQVLPSEKLALELKLGRKLSNEEFLKISATTPRKTGDAGQESLWISPYTELTNIYGGGKTALVRRPFTLGQDRMKWFDEASFNVLHNPGGNGYVTDIMAPWNTLPVLDWRGNPVDIISTAPESELISPVKMEFVDLVKGSPHMNNRTSLNSSPFFTKEGNYFDKDLKKWIINSYGN